MCFSIYGILGTCFCVIEYSIRLCTHPGLKRLLLGMLSATCLSAGYHGNQLGFLLKYTIKGHSVVG
jgi:hypothetical protein